MLKSHKEVVDRTLVLPTSTEDIGETLSSKHSAEKSLNFQALLNILSNVQVLAQQTLPLRGDKAGEINSNFMALQVLREIAAEILSADFFTIMVDETIDVANISQQCA